MWIATEYGFYSVVAATDAMVKGAGISARLHVKPDRAPAWLQVRARNVEHLMKLQVRFPEQLRGLDIYQTPDRDYPCRIFVKRRMFAAIAVELISDIEYPNFKDRIAKLHGEPSTYLDLLHGIWSMARTMQHRDEQRLEKALEALQKRWHPAAVAKGGR